MPKKRKEGTTNTTISVSWSDKNRMRRLANLRKTTKNGDVYESDSVIFNRILRHYIDTHPREVKSVTTVTYPVKIVNTPVKTPNESQQN
jgi:hypothetical protein